MMAAEAVDCDFKIVCHKICNTEQLLDFFIWCSEVYYLVTLITDSMMVWVRLVFKERFTPEGDFFDVTFSDKLIEVAIYRRKIDMGEGTLNSRCRHRSLGATEKLPNILSFLTKSLLHTV